MNKLTLDSYSFDLCSEIERIYEKYGVEMKPCENIKLFLDSLEIMQGDERPLVMSKIEEDTNKQYRFIKDQLKTIEEGIKKFKEIAMKSQILDIAKKVIS